MCWSEPTSRAVTSTVDLTAPACFLAASSSRSSSPLSIALSLSAFCFSSMFRKYSNSSSCRPAWEGAPERKKIKRGLSKSCSVA